MSNSDFEYNSQEIRQEAKKIKCCCDCIDQTALPEMRKTREIIEGNFAGMTAEVLDTRFVSLKKDIEQMQINLKSIYSVLMRFADELEKRDAELAHIIGE